MSTLDRARSAPFSDVARAHLAATLLAVAGEDRAAFKELYRLTSAKLFGICLRICGNHQNAEDVLHEVSLLIWRRAGALAPGKASPISWLAVIARNRSIDWLRAQTSRPTASLDEVPDILDWQPDAETILIAKGECIRLVECLNELDSRQRYAIVTAFFDGATYAEVAVRACRRVPRKAGFVAGSSSYRLALVSTRRRYHWLALGRIREQRDRKRGRDDRGRGR